MASATTDRRQEGQLIAGHQFCVPGGELPVDCHAHAGRGSGGLQTQLPPELLRCCASRVGSPSGCGQLDCSDLYYAPETRKPQLGYRGDAGAVRRSGEDQEIPTGDE